MSLKGPRRYCGYRGTMPWQHGCCVTLMEVAEASSCAPASAALGRAAAQRVRGAEHGRDPAFHVRRPGSYETKDMRKKKMMKSSIAYTCVFSISLFMLKFLCVWRISKREISDTFPPCCVSCPTIIVLVVFWNFGGCHVWCHCPKVDGLFTFRSNQIQDRIWALLTWKK